MGVLTLSSSHDTISYGVVASDHVTVASVQCQINNYVFASPGYLDVNATTTVKNCIFYGYNTIRVASQIDLNASNCYFSMVAASVAASTVKRHVIASNNCTFNATPNFRDITYYGYRLRGGSGCINAGVPVGVYSDIDSKSFTGTPTIGAYEYTSTPSAATFFVRYASLVEYNGDGTTFSPAKSDGGRGTWKAISNIQWGNSIGSIGPGDRLYVCGSVNEMLTISDSGNSATDNIEIYGNYASGNGFITTASSCIYSNKKNYISISNLKMRTGSHYNIFIDNGKDVKIRNCYFENSSTALKLYAATNVDIHHNIFNTGTYGILMDGCATVNIYHNTFYNFTKNAILTVTNTSTPVNIKNNIIASCDSGITFRTATGGLDEDYNYLARVTNTASNFILGANTGSTNVLPKFVYRTASNFHLRYDSPCVGTGVDVSLATDYDGIVIRGRPDIGAYEQKGAGYWFDNQYKIGMVNVTTGSRLVRGNFETKWTPADSAIQKGNLFRLDYAGAPYYTVGTILSASRIHLREVYKGKTHTSHPYMITRYVTACRGYAHVFQGDADFADICKEQIVDKIDNDIGLLYGRGPATPTATLNSARYGAMITNQASYFKYIVPASRVLEVYFKGTYKGYVGTTTGSWFPIL